MIFFYSTNISRCASAYDKLFLKKKSKQRSDIWSRRDLNTQPADLESDVLPLRHRITLPGQRKTNQLYNI